MYKPGQKLICIKRGVWRGSITRMVKDGPKYGEEVTFVGFSNEIAFPDTTFFFEEYQGHYRSKWFRPPVQISQAVKDSFPEVIEEKVETPNLEPA